MFSEASTSHCSLFTQAKKGVIVPCCGGLTARVTLTSQSYSIRFCDTLPNKRSNLRKFAMLCNKRKLTHMFPSQSHHGFFFFRLHLWITCLVVAVPTPLTAFFHLDMPSLFPSCMLLPSHARWLPSRTSPRHNWLPTLRCPRLRVRESGSAGDHQEKQLRPFDVQKDP